MLKFFKHNNAWQVIIILITVALLWARAFITPVTFQSSQIFSPLFDMLFGWTRRLPILATAIALIITLAEGLWLNSLLFSQKLIPPGSLLPMLLYIVAMSWDVEQLTITPLLMVNMMLLASISQLMTEGATTLNIERNFNASFCIGIALLFYIPAWTLIIFLILVFVTYKMYNWRQIAAWLLGLIGPMLLFLTYAFISNKLTYYLFLMQYDISNIGLRIEHAGLLLSLRNIFFITILFLPVIAQIAQSTDSTIHSRIIIRILLLPLVGGIGMMLYTQMFPADTQLFAVTFAFTTTTAMFTHRKKKWINEGLLYLILALGIL